MYLSDTNCDMPDYANSHTKNLIKLRRNYYTNNIEKHKDDLKTTRKFLRKKNTENCGKTKDQN